MMAKNKFFLSLILALVAVVALLSCKGDRVKEPVPTEKVQDEAVPSESFEELVQQLRAVHRELFVYVKGLAKDQPQLAGLLERRADINKKRELKVDNKIKKLSPAAVKLVEKRNAVKKEINKLYYQIKDKKGEERQKLAASSKALRAELAEINTERMKLVQQVKENDLKSFREIQKESAKKLQQVNKEIDQFVRDSGADGVKLIEKREAIKFKLAQLKKNKGK